MKLFVLVISYLDKKHPNYYVYLNYHNMWKKLLQFNDNVHGLFVAYSEDETLPWKKLDRYEVCRVDDTIFVKGKDSLENVYEKTIAAFAYIQNYFSFEYVLRTNYSSFWYWPRLINFLDTGESYNFVGSVKNYFSDPNDPNYKAFLEGHKNQVFDYTKIVNPSGAGFVISRDIIEGILRFQDVGQRYPNDDVGLGCVFRRIGVNITAMERCDLFRHINSTDLSDTEWWLKSKNYFYHFRNKLPDHLRSTKEMQNLQKLMLDFYNYKLSLISE